MEIMSQLLSFRLKEHIFQKKIQNFLIISTHMNLLQVCFFPLAYTILYFVGESHPIEIFTFHAVYLHYVLEVGPDENPSSLLSILLVIF